MKRWTYELNLVGARIKQDLEDFCSGLGADGLHATTNQENILWYSVTGTYCQDTYA